MKGGEIIVEALRRQKIPYVFGICGHGNVGLLDALHAGTDDIKLIAPRHEQSRATWRMPISASGTRRSRRSPPAGPGSCNLVMALAVALTDSSALLAITANVPTSQFNRSPFQELYRHFQADFPNVLQPVVKRGFQPSRVDMLPLALRQSMTRC